MNPPFDLEPSIATWRTELADKMSADALAELDTHLHAAFAELAARGLADDEALHLARRRLGGAELAEEFAKVNPDAVWAERGKWMLFGLLAFAVFWSALRISGGLLDVAIMQVIPIRTAFLAEMWIVALSTPVLYGYVLWRLVRGQWRLGWFERFTALRHPAVLATVVGTMWLVEKFVETMRTMTLFGGLQSYDYGHTLATSRILTLVISFVTLLLLAIASAIANRLSRRTA